MFAKECRKTAQNPWPQAHCIKYILSKNDSGLIHSLQVYKESREDSFRMDSSWAVSGGQGCTREKAGFQSGFSTGCYLRRVTKHFQATGQARAAGTTFHSSSDSWPCAHPNNVHLSDAPPTEVSVEKPKQNHRISRQLTCQDIMFWFVTPLTMKCFSTLLLRVTVPWNLAARLIKLLSPEFAIRELALRVPIKLYSKAVRINTF